MRRRFCNESPPPLPDLLYHASRHGGSIERFERLSHFGTLQAALDRASSGVFESVRDSTSIYEVELAAERILVVPDMHGTVHSWIKLVDQLHYDLGVLGPKERDAVFTAASPSGTNDRGGLDRISELLRGKGYDALAYVNLHEDIGNWSWIVLDPETVRIVRVLSLDDIAAPSAASTP